MPESSDADLLRRAQGGDVSAIGQLYDRNHEPIFRYVWTRVGDDCLAEDLTGEIFTRMVTHLPDYRPQGVPFRAWLYRIAHNLVVDHYRQASHHRLVPLDQAEGYSRGDDDPASLVEQQLTLERVKHALDQLDLSQREVVELRFLAGLPLREVALILDKTVAAVKSLQHRGLKTLRLVLQTE